MRKTDKAVWRYGLWLLVCLGLLALPDKATATGEPTRAPGSEIFLETSRGEYLCPRMITRRAPEFCPPFGPGTREARVDYLRARLPQPLPDLPIERMPAPEGSITRFVYARIFALPAPTYRHPAEAAAGLPPLRVFQSNINWVSIIGRVSYEGQDWFQINSDEYIQASYVDFPEPSRFQGVRVTEQPQYDFAWLRRELQPSPRPGAPPQADLVLPRRSLVTIFATEEINGKRWVMVGPDQWLPHDYISQVTVKAPPPGVPPGVKWIEVDTYEQTLAAYEGERLVYATLTTTGRHDLTPLGLFRIFRKVRAALMQSTDRSMDDRYWFHLEDVEHAQFFNERISLHAAYWHDHFGSVRSNGCINLAPLDARWLYEWTDPQLPSGGSWVTAESAGEGQTWVWVHHSGPDLRTKPAVP